MVATVANPEMFRTSTFEIREGAELMGLAYFRVVSAVGHDFAPRASGFWMEQCDLENGEVWNVTPCFWYASFEDTCARAVADAGKHSVFVSH